MSSRRASSGLAQAQAHPQPSSLLAFVQGPLRDVRTFCLDCLGVSGGQASKADVGKVDASEVEACEDRSCPLHGMRLKALHAPADRPAPRADLHLLLRACRRQCLQCAGDPAAVRSCDAKGACALWEWRFGVFPQTYASVKRRFAGRLAATPDGPSPDAPAVCAPRQDAGALLPRNPLPPRKAPCLSAPARRQAGRDLLRLCGLK
ncbi:MAG: hypothetical protein K6C33_01025 [Desulfovibrio sp.]|nr:hypothetical protein [Desulfovibrio sp.]